MAYLELNGKTASKYLTNHYSIEKYNDNYYKMVYFKYPIKNGGYEEKKKKSADRSVNDEKLNNHISRARSKIFEYSMCNEFDYFVTLTLDSKKYDRSNLAKYIKDLGQFIRDQRKKYGADIQYLLIPELHKDGKNWHMHGLIKGIKDNQLSKNKNGYLDWTSYSNKFGYCSIGPVKSTEAVSKYITKYIAKALGTNLKREKEKNLYYVSRGLKTAEKVKEGSLTSSQLAELTFNFENDYIKLLDLNGLQFLRICNQLDQL